MFRPSEARKTGLCTINLPKQIPLCALSVCVIVYAQKRMFMHMHVCTCQRCLRF